MTYLRQRLPLRVPLPVRWFVIRQTCQSVFGIVVEGSSQRLSGRTTDR